MKELKSRIWSNEYNQYLTPYGYPNGHSDLWIKCETGQAYDLQGNYEYDSGVDISEIAIKNCTIEHFTGERDINKKEYCEGDRVKMEGCITSIIIGETTTIYGEVKYFSGGFHFWNKDGWCEPIGNKPMSAEIVGTIHD